MSIKRTIEIEKKEFDAVVSELKELSSNAALSAVGDAVALNRKLAEFLIQTTVMVEDEALRVNEAMRVAFDKKGQRMLDLNSVTENVAKNVAFMKQSLNTVNAKTTEIESLINAMSRLNESIKEFRSFVNDGTLDMIMKAAASIR